MNRKVKQFIIGSCTSVVLWFTYTYAGHAYQFDDVPPEHWAAESINQLVEEEVVEGYGDNNFGPDDEIRRDHAAVLMVRVLDLETGSHSGNDMIDVDDSDEFMEEIAAVVDAGLFEGNESGQFEPKETLTRAELSSVLFREFDFDEEKRLSFVDVDEGHWASREIGILAGNNIVTGYPGGDFMPDNSVTRAQFVTFLDRVFKETSFNEGKSPEGSVIVDQPNTTVDLSEANEVTVGAEEVTLKNGEVSTLTFTENGTSVTLDNVHVNEPVAIKGERLTFKNGSSVPHLTILPGDEAFYLEAVEPGGGDIHQGLAIQTEAPITIDDEELVAEKQVEYEKDLTIRFEEGANLSGYEFLPASSSLDLNLQWGELLLIEELKNSIERQVTSEEVSQHEDEEVEVSFTLPVIEYEIPMTATIYASDDEGKVLESTDFLSTDDELNLSFQPDATYEEEYTVELSLPGERIIKETVTVVPEESYEHDDLTPKEFELAQLINEYRESLGLNPLPVSSSLTEVARTHVEDSNEYSPEDGKDERGEECNLHSWSENGEWTPVCYTSDHEYSEKMWNKPRELTGYQGNGFEISVYSGVQLEAERALDLWKNSSAHNDVIIGEGNWGDLEVMGVGIEGHYAHVWFGREEDEEGYYVEY